ncbi:MULTISPECIES: WD40 repeat domain-containing protein [unclassified Mesorhizobium]|uniref:WD40 repeat domain-containing protein n=1 Tax=unclassified Mesorhizobium TaxID=325217 RepID=UPI001CCE28D4|nr:MULTISPECIES: hypothetical protein [unclassified Mesorhizobium]MBZ9741535.1 hypothetical protein [Mesorhizobium sp. CO1-1-4]MBZ9805182.1 hypothetical protein [Mesorhizobium sp. ES1-6]
MDDKGRDDKGRVSFRLMRACRWLAMAGALVSASVARAEDAPDFHLDLDTGGHSARVTDLAFTPDGEELVSASDDKTIRVWDWQSGVSLRTIRGYLGNGNDGKIFAVAVSPDGIPSTALARAMLLAPFGCPTPWADQA